MAQAYLIRVTGRLIEGIPSTHVTSVGDAPRTVALARSNACSATNIALIQHISHAVAGAGQDSRPPADAAVVDAFAAVWGSVAARTAQAVSVTHTACIQLLAAVHQTIAADATRPGRFNRML